MVVNKTTGVIGMLLEFRCSNHKSIKNEITFSMLAGSDDTHEKSLRLHNGMRILRTAVVYGPNGSGKSNFIDALNFCALMVDKSMRFQPGEKVPQSEHKTSEEGDASSYAIQFLKEGIRYAYGFTVQDQEIAEEYLYYFPKGRQVKIFERSGQAVTPGDRYKSSFQQSLNVLKENRLFLACGANFSNVKEVEAAFLFFTRDLVIYDSKKNNWMDYSLNLMRRDPDIKKIFLILMRLLGNQIRDVRIPENQTKRIEAQVVYDQFETDLMTEESDGVKKLFEILCPLIDILSKGRVLICDELETCLHEALIYQIAELFQRTSDRFSAQLIFSTHDTSLLDSNLFRRDQIWFTELNEERATNLYSLMEIRNVRKTENLKNGYILGKYGAIPMRNKNFWEEFEKQIEK